MVFIIMIIKDLFVINIIKFMITMVTFYYASTFNFNYGMLINVVIIMIIIELINYN